MQIVFLYSLPVIKILNHTRLLINYNCYGLVLGVFIFKRTIRIIKFKTYKKTTSRKI